MCTAPGLLNSGQLVGCRKCWQCKERRVNDWAGRCIAEGKTAIASNSLCLTYGRDKSELRYGAVDHERAAVLTYTDVQKYLKLLRYHKYPLRYLVAGEYGSEKGRSHWHLLIFWTSRRKPEFRIDVREDTAHWPHGFGHWDELTHRSVFYACKYLQKDTNDDDKQGHLSMSKQPPLGDTYFKQLAMRYVDAMLAPQDLLYSFAGVNNKMGERKQFYMSPATARNFVAEYNTLWARHHPGVHQPSSELVEVYTDRATKKEVSRREAERDWETDLAFEEKARLLAKPVRWRTTKPWLEPPGKTQVHFSESSNTYYTNQDGGKLYWSYDEEGNRAWRTKIVSESVAERSAESAINHPSAHSRYAERRSGQ